MASRTTKALSLTAALSLVSNPVADLGDAAKKAFDEFFGSGQSSVEKTVSDYGTNTAYAEERKSLDSRVDTTTYWTPDKLRQIINEPKLSFIYWKIEVNDEIDKLGDKFFRDVLRDYGSRLDRIIIIEGLRHGKSAYKDLKNVLDEFNPSEREYSHNSPIYSFVGFGAEGRIRGPPKDHYEEKYKGQYKSLIEGNISWFNNKKRETFLDIKQQ